MNIITYLAIPFILSMSLVLLLVPPAKTILKHFGLVDKPSARRINKKPIVRGAGIVIFLVVTILSLIFRYYFHDISPWKDSHQYLLILLSSTILVLTGLADDALNLNPIVKLIVQILVSSLSWYAGASIQNVLIYELPPYLNYALTLGWFILIINAFNLIDGMDGLSSGLALIGSIGLTTCYIFRGNIAQTIPLVLLAGACLGFLRYNFNPASVFLGDCGSLFLGHTLAVIPLVAGGKGIFIASLGIPILVIGIPLFDTCLAIWRRSMRAILAKESGEEAAIKRIILPDMDHLHHRLLNHGLNQRRAATVLYIASIILVIAAISASVFIESANAFITLGILAVILLLSRHLTRVELWDTGRAFIQATHAPRFARLLPPIYIALDISMMLLAWYASFRLSGLSAFDPKLHFLSTLPIFFLPICLGAIVFGIYRRVWNLADGRDFAILFLTPILGWIIGTITAIIIGHDYPGFRRQTLLFTLLFNLATVLTRVLRATASRILAASESMRLRDQGGLRTIIYGAGERFGMVTTATTQSLLGSRTWYPVGLIDDNPSLRGRIVHGQYVLGNINNIDAIIEKTHPKQIIVASDLRPENRIKIRQAAEKYNLTLIFWTCGFEVVRDADKKENK